MFESTNTTSAAARLDLDEHLLDVRGGRPEAGETAECVRGWPVIGQLPLDGLPDPGARGQTPSLRGTADGAVELVGDDDLETSTHVLILP